VTSFAGGAGQAAYVSRVRDLAPQRCLVVPVDVGKRTAMALVADHYGQILGDPFEFELTVSGVDRLGAVIDGVATAVDGSEIPVRANCVCVHSDTPNAVDVAKAVHEALRPHMSA